MKNTNPILPSELEPLREELARHVHDTWMEGRLADGWVYGPERNDELKTHPCLVDYDSLPESERDYDRRTAAATIRFILDRGYKLTPR